MSWPRFGDSGESSAPKKCIGDTLVYKGAEALKPRLSPVIVRMLTPAADGLLHAGFAYRTQGTISSSTISCLELRRNDRGEEY